MAVVHCVRTLGHNSAPICGDNEIAVALRLCARWRRRRLGGRLRRHGYLGRCLRRRFARLRRVRRTGRRGHGGVARQRIHRLFVSLLHELHDAEDQQTNKGERKEQKRRMDAVFPDARQTEGKALTAVIGGRAARRRSAAGGLSRGRALCRAADGAGAVIVPARARRRGIGARLRFSLRETPAVKRIRLLFRRLRRGAISAGRIRLAISAVAAPIGIVCLLHGIVIRVGLPRLRRLPVRIASGLYRAAVRIGLRLHRRRAAVSRRALLQIAAAESIPRYFRESRAFSAVRLLPLLRPAVIIITGIIRIALRRAALRRVRHGTRRGAARFGGRTGAASVFGCVLGIFRLRPAGARRAAHAVYRQLGKKGALAPGRCAVPLRRARCAVSPVVAGFAVFHVEKYLRIKLQSLL